MLRNTKAITISLLPDLFNKAKKFAQEEHRTMSELFREALRSYIEERTWQRLSNYGSMMAKKQGFTEEDINVIVEKSRHEQS
ncbi:MAG: ribbon-helix-helix protein, CopG family [Nitrospirae bacterium]|nr:ribbon-helix-helix protein, CopG family [Nitrospirota bacterium]